MKKLTTINPATEEVLHHYDVMSPAAVTAVIEEAQYAFNAWGQVPLEERCRLLDSFRDLLLQNKSTYARLITDEMGKPISAATLEIEKCAWLCEHYAQSAAAYLEPKVVKTELEKSYIAYEPLGIIFAIMPWNYPFWQILRCAVPNLILGNAVLVKSAFNSTGAGLAIESLCKEAGFPESLLRALLITPDMSEAIIQHPYVQGVTITGSERTGRVIAAQAGAALKKSVMELGGSDACLILEDNDEMSLKQAVNGIVASRLAVSGQVCIAPKRFIVVKKHYNTVLELVQEALSDYSPCSPLLPTCKLGPLARSDLRDTVHQQVQDSIKAGARCLQGGQLPEGVGFYYPPTVLVDIPHVAPAYHEEIFGPVVSLFQVENEIQAVALANDTTYGLGVSLFTRNIKQAEHWARYTLKAGVCSVNTRVASDPRLPFGGIKNSGYGRELGREGLLEFANIKTIQVTTRPGLF